MAGRKLCVETRPAEISKLCRQDTRGITHRDMVWRHILGHDRPSPDYGAVADAHSLEHQRTGADERAATDHNGFGLSGAASPHRSSPSGEWKSLSKIIASALTNVRQVNLQFLGPACRQVS
jgi:hypothetical protein